MRNAEFARRLRRLVAVMLLGLIAAAISTPPDVEAATRAHQAPASRIIVDLPDGYAPSELFSGFANEAIGISIVVVEMPEKAYGEIAAGMTAETLARKGIVGATRATLERPQPYVYMRAEQVSQAGRYAKFFVVLQQGGLTALITANVPQGAIEGGIVSVAEIETALASARVAETAAPVRDLFRLGDTGPFRMVEQRLGATRLFTVDGRNSLREGVAGRPLLIIAPSLDRRPVASLDAEARNLIRGLPGLDGLEVVESQSAAIAGMRGVELIGRAKDVDSATDVTVYQVLLAKAHGGYFRIVGQFASAEAGMLVPLLRRVAASFEPLDP